MFSRTLLLLLTASRLSLAAQDVQQIFTSNPKSAGTHQGQVVDEAILNALKLHPDPVDALISLNPEVATELSQPRLLHVVGEVKPKWMTEGDKLRLRRDRKKFIDITDHEDFYKQQAGTTLAGKASMFLPRSHGS
jgi:bacterial leucyl aminopeptidase